MTRTVDPYEDHRKPDVYGRVWLGCESGLALTKASMTRFIMFILENHIGVSDLHAFDRRFKGSLVMCIVHLRPDQVEAFERETGGKLQQLPTINLNCGRAA